MNIRVKLIALDDQLPPGFAADGEGTLQVEDGATVATAMAALGLQRPEAYAVLVNDQTVPAGERPRRRLAENDSLVVFPPIDGG